MLDLRSYLLGDVPLQIEVVQVRKAKDKLEMSQISFFWNVYFQDLQENIFRNAAQNQAVEAGGDNGNAENARQNDNDPVAQRAGGDGGAGGDAGAAGGLGLVIGGGLGAAHQALLLRDGPAGFQQYKRPTLFPLKVCKSGPTLKRRSSIVFSNLL